MALRTKFIYYRARNDGTGKTVEIVDAQKNGVDITGLNGLGFAEVDGSNQPGVYRLNLTDALLIAANVLAVKDDIIQLYINDTAVGLVAPAIVKFQVHEETEDSIFDLIEVVEGKVDTIDGIVDTILVDTADMQPRIVDIETDVDANRTTLESGTFGLSALKDLIDSMQTTIDNIQNVTRFSAAVSSRSVIPSAGNNDYRATMQLFDTDGNLEDPDTNQIEVSAKDETGANVTAAVLIFGTQSDNGNGKIDAVKDSTGQYRFDYRVANTQSPGTQITFLFEYEENSKPLAASRVTDLIDDLAASGSALESTSQDILDDTADMEPRVADIQTKINSATFGLAALKDLIDVIDSVVDGNATILGSGSFGNSALKDLIDSLQGDITDDVKGSGFSNSTDSLKEISDRVFSGGEAI